MKYLAFMANLPAPCLACMLAGCSTYNPSVDIYDVMRDKDFSQCREFAGLDHPHYYTRIQECLIDKGYMITWDRQEVLKNPAAWHMVTPGTEL